jgi:hypothetical protein
VLNIVRKKIKIPQKIFLKKSIGGPQAITACPVLVVCRTNNIPSPGGLQAYIYLGISSSAVKPWHNPAV